MLKPQKINFPSLSEEKACLFLINPFITSKTNRFNRFNSNRRLLKFKFKFRILILILVQTIWLILLLTSQVS